MYFLQLRDTPSAKIEKNMSQYEHYEILQYEREDEFELMLTAVEENSGHMIILATVEWGKSLVLSYDRTQLMHSRMSVKDFQNYCRLKNSKLKVFMYSFINF